MSLWQRAKQSEVHPINRQAEADDRQPEKIPMKTERVRKNTSSLKTPSSVENKRRGFGSRACEAIDDAAGAVFVGPSCSLTRSLAFLRNQKQCQIEAPGLSANCSTLLFDLKDHIHNRIWKIGFSRRAETR